jgi:hypothetical protein
MLFALTSQYATMSAKVGAGAALRASSYNDEFLARVRRQRSQRLLAPVF